MQLWHKQKGKQHMCVHFKANQIKMVKEKHARALIINPTIQHI